MDAPLTGYAASAYIRVWMSAGSRYTVNAAKIRADALAAVRGAQRPLTRLRLAMSRAVVRVTHARVGGRVEVRPGPARSRRMRFARRDPARPRREAAA